MDTDEVARALADRIRRAFDPDPMPQVPPGYGDDPFGVDETRAFVGARWTEVPPASYGNQPVDVHARVWFKTDATNGDPRFWNYYMPGFMVASLLHDDAHDVAWWFMERMVNVPPPPHRVADQVPWWGGSIAYERFTPEQIRCVVDFIGWYKATLVASGGFESEWTRARRTFESAWERFASVKDATDETDATGGAPPDMA